MEQVFAKSEKFETFLKDNFKINTTVFLGDKNLTNLYGDYIELESKNMENREKKSAEEIITHEAIHYKLKKYL